MSEKYQKKIEVGETNLSQDHERSEVKHDKVEAPQSEGSQAEKLLDARAEVTKESSEKDKLLDKLNTEQESSSEEDIARRPADSNLKKATFAKEISHVRRKLSKSERRGSKVIHQPVIRVVSEVSAKTITRPSGLLGGGIAAFLGTTIYLYLTKHIGLKYNYSVFLFLLVAGFILGLIVEAVIRLSRGRKSI